MDEIELLYEDNHLLIVVKPYGIPSQADATGDPDMLTRMKAYIKAYYNKPGEVYLGLVHRLDRPVGGIMVFARTSKAAARLDAQLRSGAFRKTYLAVVRGGAPGGELTDYLFKVEEENHVYVADAQTPGAKLARLSYRTLASREGLSLVSVELYTGRSHQIRVQMANAGFPIWGDNRYGGGKSGQRIALFAAKLRLEHPTKKTELQFIKRPPSLAPWDMFESEIEAFARSREGVKVLYEDENLVIAEKQPGLETQGETSAESAVSAIVGCKVFACHRLDAMTGGLLMFAKNEAAREAAEQAMRNGKVAKTYRCLVKGIPRPREAVLEAYLSKDAARARVTVSARETPMSKRIVTEYATLGERGGNALLNVTLHTGRTHQIRAHMAFIGHPILGDDKYGDRRLNKALKIKHQALWAANLAFAFGGDSVLSYLNGMEFESRAAFE